MPSMTLSGMHAHEIDLLGKGFHIEILETGPHKRSEGRYLCRIGKGQLGAALVYNDNLHTAKRDAIIKTYDELNEEKMIRRKRQRKGKKNGLHD